MMSFVLDKLDRENSQEFIEDVLWELLFQRDALWAQMSLWRNNKAIRPLTWFSMRPFKSISEEELGELDGWS